MNADFLDMLKCLNKANVDYLLVGGWAVNFHGYIRTTVDLDIWVLADANNARHIYQALVDFGAPLQNIKAQDFEKDDLIFQIGVAPCRIDVITKIDGLNYSDARKKAIRKEIKGIPINVISKEDLIVNKRSTGRIKDIADAEILEGL